MKKNHYRTWSVKIIILLFMIIIILPITLGDNVNIKNLDKENNYFFEKLYYKSNSQQNNITKLIEINDLNIEDESIPVVNNTLSTNLSSGPMDSCWPMKCHDLHHTSQSPYSTAGNPGGEKWRFQTGGHMESGMVINKDGVIYFGDLSSWTFYAIYPDGSLKWKYKTKGLVWSTPAIAEDGTIYIGSYDTRLYSFNPDGSLKWYFGSGGSISSSPAIGTDGTIYFGTMGEGDGDIIALNPDGSLKWRYTTGYYIVSDPAIADDGTIYIGSGDGYLYAMNPNGTLKWRYSTGVNAEIHSHPSIAEDGTIYFGSDTDYLYAINPDGTKKWEKYFGSTMYNSASIGNDGTIYAATDTLYALNPSNGSIKWYFNIHGAAYSSPAIGSDGTIYLGNGNYIIAVNPDGTERWSKKIANHCAKSSPCIGSNGEIYIGSSSDLIPDGSIGYLHCFAPQNNNHPPETPYVDGRKTDSINKEIYINIRGSDPDNNPISYDVEWGDGTYTYGIYAMDNEIGKSYAYHTYSSTGIYNIRVKARDDFGGESDWGTFRITISKNRNNIQTLLYSFIQNHPILKDILKILNNNI